MYNGARFAILTLAVFALVTVASPVWSNAAVSPLTTTPTPNLGNTGTIPVEQTCDTTKQSMSQTANQMCPADPQYDYTCEYGQPDKSHPNEICEKGKTCSEPGGSSGQTISGTCQCASVCQATTNKSTTTTKVAAVGNLNGVQAPPASVLGDTKTPDLPAPTQPTPGATNASSAAAPATPPASNAGAPVVPQTSTANAAPTSISTQSGSVNGTGAAAQGLGSTQTPNLPSPSASFTGNTNLNNVSNVSPLQAAQPNPLTSPVNSSGYPNAGPAASPYTPTHSTFGEPTYTTPIITASSPLTNFVSSVGNLGTFFNYLSSVFTPAPVVTATLPTVIQNNQIIVQTPVLSTLVGQPPKVSKDTFSGTLALQTSVQTNQQNQSLLDFMTGTQPSATPSEIASLLQIGNSTGGETQTTIAPGNGSLISELEQQMTSSIALDQTINSQPPAISPLALETTNGLENYQNIPEQFYIEEAALAQAQSNYQWLEAQIAAWKNAQEAGVCDSACENALGILENEVPGQSDQVQQLQAVVDQGPAAFEASSSSPTPSALNTNTGPVEIPEVTTQVPGAGQDNVVAGQASTLQTPVPAEGAPFYTKQNGEWCDQYDQCILASSFESSPQVPSATVVAGFAATTSASTAAEDPITAIEQTVKGWVSDIAAIFTPNASANGQPAQPCSLFKSIFGGCGSAW